MGRLETRPFSEEHVPAAGELLAARHREHRAAEPLLPVAYELPEAAAGAVRELWRAADASGAIGVRDGRVVAFVVGIRKDDGVWGANVWIENAGSAADSPEDLRDVYAAAAAAWVEAGRVRHYAVVPALRDLVEPWFRLSFGAQHAYGIREVPDAEWPESVRRGEPRDLEDLVALTPLLARHQDATPTFAESPSAQQDEDELRRAIGKDLADAELGELVVERDGRIVAAFENVPLELSSTHTALARPEHAAFLAWAVSEPGVRGSGAGVALTEATFAWARERGYETIVTDWRETNLLSSRFWRARGFRPSFLRLYRHIP